MGKVVAKSSVETPVVKIEESKPHDELL